MARGLVEFASAFVTGWSSVAWKSFKRLVGIKRYEYVGTIHLKYRHADPADGVYIAHTFACFANPDEPSKDRKVRCVYNHRYVSTYDKECHHPQYPTLVLPWLLGSWAINSGISNPSPWLIKTAKDQGYDYDAATDNFVRSVNVIGDNIIKINFQSE